MSELVKRASNVLRLAPCEGEALAQDTIRQRSLRSRVEWWFENSRWIGTARPNREGGFRISTLPAGAYLAIAVDYVEDGMWNDAEYLESIRRFAQRVTVSEGGSQTLSLKLVTP